MNLKWESAKVAAGWPEGSIVLIQRTAQPVSHYRSLELVTHFRPDWVSKEIGYGCVPMRFCFLSSFVWEQGAILTLDQYCGEKRGSFKRFLQQIRRAEERQWEDIKRRVKKKVAKSRR